MPGRALPSATDRRPRQRGATSVPLTVVDEAVHLLDSPWDPWSIQVEVGVEGRLEADRLRRALGAAVARHPMARARLAPARHRERQLRWELGRDADVDPLKVVDCPDGEALADLRADFHSLQVPLVESPPLRARLVHRPGGDLLALNVNHTAFDGFGALRLLRSVGRAYRGAPDTPDPVTLADARDLPRHLRAPGATARARRWVALGQKLADLARPPVALASVGAHDRPGYGFHHVEVDVPTTSAIVDPTLVGTVNDRLLAALHLAADRWNRHHGGSPGRIGVLVPVNLRPPTWRHEVVTNFVLQARVASGPRERRSTRPLLEAVARRSARVRAGSGAALMEVLNLSPRLPLWAKRPLPALLWLTGQRFVDTAVLSNLGHVADPPHFGPGPGAGTEIWFSAPARMPCGLSLGAATAGGRLRLVFRYRTALFDGAAASGFAARYLAALDDVRRAAA